MPANAIIKTIALGGPQWTPVGDKSMVAQATLIADPKNTGTINMRFRQGTPAEWPPGAAVPMESVDLGDLEVQGNAGHALHIAAFAPGAEPRGGTQRSGTKLFIPIPPATGVETLPGSGELG